ncbi:MAG: sigma-70 family RNA polymerase sigma factor [Deltaproteobacteria bacterium]|nr:sigma-70 family RNA polymerase sigma factor [Deltaproteobacteria bacterium]NIS77217.1 sigma-70 family RNA polymerase sigma factor [Deltaproteobacteria bacterium]
MADRELDFQSVYDSFHPRINRYLTRLVGQSEADDLTQEVFVKVSRGLSDFRGDAKLSTWVYRIATNVAMDRLRSMSAGPAISKTSVSEEGKAFEDRDLWTGEKKPSMDRQMIREEMSECVHEFIDRLPESYRAVVLLSEVEGLKNREIAEVLGISLDTVKIRLHRGRSKLKEELESGCSFDRDEKDVLVCDRKEPTEESS